MRTWHDGLKWKRYKTVYNNFQKKDKELRIKQMKYQLVGPYYILPQAVSTGEHYYTLSK